MNGQNSRQTPFKSCIAGELWMIEFIKSQLQHLPTEVLDQIVFFAAFSNRDVINFSSCCKTIREELLESNTLVISLRVASDIRKLGNINCKRMKALKKQDFKKPNQKEMQENKRKFNDYKTTDGKQKKKKKEEGGISQITKAFNLTTSHLQVQHDDDNEYEFEKWLTETVEGNINTSRRETELKTNSITMTNHFKTLWKRLLNEYFLFESGEEICEIISRCVYNKVEYSSWKTKEQEYPRVYTYKGEFNIGNDKFSFYSSENDLGYGYWYLKVNDSPLLSCDDNIVTVKTIEFNSLKLKVLGEHQEKLNDSSFVIVLLSLVDFCYAESRNSLGELQFE